MSIACAVLMCHAPIVVPEIAGPRAARCETTTRAMREAAEVLVAHEPEVVVLVSPHAPRHRTRWGIVHDDTLHGTFARFGHAALAVGARGAPEAARTLAACAAEAGLTTHEAAGRALDHGTLVPLYFLREAGYTGRVLSIALPYPDAGTELAFGGAIAAAAERLGQRWAVLASGDMSHRLTPDAPAGHDPRGALFDQAFVAELGRGALSAAIGLPHELVAHAAEDVVQSTTVAAGAVRMAPRGVRVLAYEGPFGVGYCEAVLHTALGRARDGERTPPPGLVDIALDAITHALAEEPFDPPALPPPWDAPRAVFVTLRSPDGALRGCIGRTQPLLESLAEEVADCARGAALRDRRVAPIAASELPDLRIEISVLGPLELTGREQLDPARYGIVVQHGGRRGVLLPAIEGIDTVDAQLRIALHKAGIAPDATYRLERFTVDKVVRQG